MTGTALGIPSRQVCPITVSTGAGEFSCQGWSDYGTQVTLGALQLSQDQRWATGESSFADKSGVIQDSSSYYSQVLEDFQYLLVGSTSAPTAPDLSYTGFGANSSFPLTGSAGAQALIHRNPLASRPSACAHRASLFRRIGPPGPFPPGG